MDLDLLKTFGQIAAPAGIAIGVFLYVARDVIAKYIFSTLTRERAYYVIVVLAFAAWTVALAGIASWTYVTTHTPPKSEVHPAVRKVPPLPSNWIFAGHFNIDCETFIERPYLSVHED